MAFDSTLQLTPDAAVITLAGELDASAAPAFRTAIEEAAGGHPTRLVLMMQGLNYMASAGLRALVFAKQKMGSGVEIYVIGAQEGVAETIEMTGFHHSVTMQSEYSPA